MQTTYSITEKGITEILQSLGEQLEANPETVDALAVAGLEDYTNKRREMDLDGDLTPTQQHRAISRYAYLMGYALALYDVKTSMEAATGDGDEAGDFALCVDSDGMAPAFHAGDVLTIRRAAFTSEMQTHGAVICQGGRYILGRVAIEKDGSGILYNGGGAIHFDADDFVGYAIAVRRDL